MTGTLSLVTSGCPSCIKISQILRCHGTWGALRGEIWARLVLEVEEADELIESENCSEATDPDIETGLEALEALRLHGFSGQCWRNSCLIVVEKACNSSSRPKRSWTSSEKEQVLAAPQRALEGTGGGTSTNPQLKASSKASIDACHSETNQDSWTARCVHLRTHGATSPW